MTGRPWDVHQWRQAQCRHCPTNVQGLTAADSASSTLGRGRAARGVENSPAAAPIAEPPDLIQVEVVEFALRSRPGVVSGLGRRPCRLRSSRTSGL